MALAGVPPWNDQNIFLYHGTSDQWAAAILRAVDLRQAQALTDFGRGFYTTTKLDQARSWAKNVARIWGGSAAVVEFELQREALAQLRMPVLHLFRHAGRGFLEFCAVLQNHTGRPHADIQSRVLRHRGWTGAR